VLHSAVDYSAGLAVFRLSGPNSRDLLAADCGIDFRPDAFTVGTCCRTRLAQIAAVLVAAAPERTEIYVDRGYDSYLYNWLTDTASIADSIQIR
jgi:heterotetrameric sarcosine oxidase gamma subunit